MNSFFRFSVLMLSGIIITLLLEHAEQYRLDRNGKDAPALKRYTSTQTLISQVNSNYRLQIQKILHKNKHNNL